MKFKNLDFKKEPALSAINIFLYLILALIICLLLLKITGNSPLFETIITTVGIALLVNMLRHEFLLGKFLGEHKEFKDNVKRSFQNLRDDIKELKKK